MALRTFQRIVVKPGLTLAEIPATLERLQDAIESAMQGQAANPMAQAVSMDDVTLVVGDQTIRHRLGRKPKAILGDPRVTLVSATESSMIVNSTVDLTCSILLM